MSPTFESSSDLWLEHSNFLGCVLGAIAYGFFVTLFFITVYYILQAPRERNSRTINLRVAYSCLLLAVTTVNVAADIRWNMLTFIDNRYYPGGPVAYGYIQTAELITATTAYIALNFLTDGLVLYRCLIIWQDNYYVMAFPFLMFLTSTALSILTVYQSAQPDANLWTTQTVNFAVPYWVLSISLNIIVTILIAGRLFMMRKRMREALGDSHAKKYTSAIAMLVESAALYSVTGLIFIIAYARGSYVQNLIVQVLTSNMAAAPLLILLRVASGNGFCRETTVHPEITKISFVARPAASASQDIISGQSMDEMVQICGNDSGSLKPAGRGSECC